MHILCTICTDPVNPTENLHATNCGHLFHYHCLSEWIERSSTCPQCRRFVTYSCIFRVYPTMSDETVREVAILQGKLDDAMKKLETAKDNEELLKVYTVELDSRNSELERLKGKLKYELTLQKSHISEIQSLRRSLDGYITESLHREKLYNDLSTQYDEQENELDLQLEETRRLRDENDVLKKNIQTLKKTLFKSEFENNDLRKKLSLAEHAGVADKFTVMSQRLKLGQLSQKNLVRTLARLHSVLLTLQKSNNNAHKNDLVEKLSKMLAEGVNLGSGMQLSKIPNSTCDESSKMNSNSVASGLKSGINKTPSKIEDNHQKSSSNVANTNKNDLAEKLSKLLAEGVELGSNIKLSKIPNIKCDKVVDDSASKMNSINVASGLKSEINKSPSNIEDNHQKSSFNVANTHKEDLAEKMSKLLAEAAELRSKIKLSKIPNITSDEVVKEESKINSICLATGLKSELSESSSNSKTNQHKSSSVDATRFDLESKELQNKKTVACDEQSSKMLSKDKVVLVKQTPQQSKELTNNSGDEILTEQTSEAVRNGIITGARPKQYEKRVKEPSKMSKKEGLVSKTENTEKSNIMRDDVEKPLSEMLSNVVLGSKQENLKEMPTKTSSEFVFGSSSKESEPPVLGLWDDTVKERLAKILEGISIQSLFGSTSQSENDRTHNGYMKAHTKVCETLPENDSLRAKPQSQKPWHDQLQKPQAAMSKGFDFGLKPKQTENSQVKYIDDENLTFRYRIVKPTKMIRRPSSKQSNSPNTSWYKTAKERLSKLLTSYDTGSTSNDENSSSNERDHHLEELAKSLSKIDWPKTFQCEMPSSRDGNERMKLLPPIASTSQIGKPIFEMFLKEFEFTITLQGNKNNSASKVTEKEKLSTKLAKFFESKTQNSDTSKGDVASEGFKFEAKGRFHVGNISGHTGKKKTGQVRWNQLKQLSAPCYKEELRNEKARRITRFSVYPIVPFKFPDLD